MGGLIESISTKNAHRLGGLFFSFHPESDDIDPAHFHGNFA